MPRYLLSLNIGPVQGFIAAALRTRDLWFGSHVLSVVSQAAASYLKEQGVDLIFPAHTNASIEQTSTIPNRLLVEAKTDDPAGLLQGAETAARRRWADFASEAWDRAPRHVLRQEVWDRQVEDVLECFFAWTVIEADDYRAARRRLERLVAGRKATRDFRPAAVVPTEKPGYGLPKSSLDGQRETVLQEGVTERQRRRLRLGEVEQLDCPGLVKRLAGREAGEQFTPVPRIALDPWVRELESAEEGKARLAKVNEVLDKLVKYDVVTRVKGNTDENQRSIYAALPYDGELLYPFRVDAVRRNCRKRIADETERKAVLGLLEQLQGQLRPLWQAQIPGEPCPYMALLMADGDRMGEALDALDKADEHRRISSAVAQFAKEVPDWVRASRGHCIYAGGDDVFALVPLDGVLGCANLLRDTFESVVAQEIHNMGLKIRRPTLSVGIGVGHMLEHFGRLRQLAQRAERLAKGDDRPKQEQRNALAIIVRPRSGTETVFRDRWENNPHERLTEWVDMYRKRQLPDRTAYELRTASRELTGLAPVATRGAADTGRLASLEAKRILTHKRGEGGEEPVDPALRERFQERAEEVGLGRLADELIVARWLARHVTE